MQTESGIADESALPIDLPITSYTSVDIAQYQLQVRKLEAEITRLNLLVDERGSVNEGLRDKCARAAKDNALKMKELQRLRGGNKYDKIASEGLIKKNGSLVHEVTGLQQTVSTLKEEVIFCRHTNQTLQDRLNIDRSKRLQLLHENELLVQRLHTAEAYERRELREVQENVRSAQLQEDRIHKLDADREAQKEFIGEQFGDIQRQAEERTQLMRDKIRMGEELVARARVIALLESENACLKRESSLAQTSPMTRGAGVSGRLTLTDSVRERAVAVGVVSPEATPLRPRLPLRSEVDESSPHASLRRTHNVAAPSHLSLTPVTASGLSSTARAPIASLTGSRSRFLGSGLRLRHCDEEQFRPSGSAKHILKTVLAGLDLD